MMTVVGKTRCFKTDAERFLRIVHACGEVYGLFDVQRNIEDVLQPVGVVDIGADGKVVGLCVGNLRKTRHSGHFAANEVG